MKAPPRTRRSAGVADETLQENARLLESVLQDFGVKGDIINVRPGPVVTLYELEPAPGTKSSRVIGLADDIARSMSAVAARVAVIPGRNAIGIELPNAQREMVYFREILETDTLPALGGRPGPCARQDDRRRAGDRRPLAHAAPADRRHHRFGQVGRHQHHDPVAALPADAEQCRFIMIDPKMLELSVYDGIPHLLAPVVTDPKKAVVALKWTVREMEERYRKRCPSSACATSTATTLACARPGPRARPSDARSRPASTGRPARPSTKKRRWTTSPMPYIVVIVDEMADLMMVAGKDIEGAVQRLAQMARAAGIHLIMATQRPSVDVMTGTIKANFPTRISFQVTSKIDSRTILGEQGAEQLLGQGDMLYMAGGGRIMRVHGPFVADEEVEKVVRHFKKQGVPDYLEDITEGGDMDEGGLDADEPRQALGRRSLRPGGGRRACRDRQGLDQLYPAAAVHRIQPCGDADRAHGGMKASSDRPTTPASARSWPAGRKRKRRIKANFAAVSDGHGVDALRTPQRSSHLRLTIFP